MNKGQFIGRSPLYAVIPMGHNGFSPATTAEAGFLDVFFPERPSLLHSRSVVLPAAGNRNGTSINNVGANGNYWSSMSQSETNAYNVNFNATNFNAQNNNNRYNGFSVRLAVVSALTFVVSSRSDFPAAGRRDGTSISYVGANGNYWSSTSQSETNAYNVNFNETNFNAQNNWDRFRGFSVRLAVVSALTFVVSSRSDSKKLSESALFLPAAGYRSGTTIGGVSSEGNYWSSMSQSETNAYNVNFNATNFNAQNNNNRCNGRSVRLAVVSALALKAFSLVLPESEIPSGRTFINITI